MKLKCLYIPALAFLMAACGNAPDYRNAIPAKSAAVVAVDLNSMSEKMGLSGEKADKALLDKLENMVKSGLTGSDALIERIFDDGSESGLALKNKVYLFDLRSVK